MLDNVLEILQWESDQYRALDLAESRYTSLLAGALGRQLHILGANDPASAERIFKLLAGLDTEALRRVLLAPETSSRLIFEHPGCCDNRTFWEVLLDVLEVEARQVNDASPGLRRARWSALCDSSLDAGGTILISQPTLAGLVVDAKSPAAVCFNPDSIHEGKMQLQHYGEAAAEPIALHKVATAMSAIHSASRRLANFVRHFKLVANVVVDAEQSRFSSGSTGEYVGRSLFCNVHLQVVHTELLGESLVHEAIHSLLYMHETCEAWVRHEDLLTHAVIESPWTDCCWEASCRHALSGSD